MSSRSCHVLPYLVFARADVTEVDSGERLSRYICLLSLIAQPRHRRLRQNLYGLHTCGRCFRPTYRQERAQKGFPPGGEAPLVPHVKTFRELPLQDTQATSKCAQLIPAWKGLGQALKLEEAKEKADYEHEIKKAAQLCAWVKCEYHEKKPPEPTRACVGCGEARYCSRPCQQKYVFVLLYHATFPDSSPLQGLERRRA